MFFISACSNNIEINEIIDINKPLKLYIKLENKENILVGSDKWKKLITFTNENLNNWKNAPVSYMPDISVIQGDFRLLYWINKENVVIGFLDKNGKARQLHKKIETAVPDFLIE